MWVGLDCFGQILVDATLATAILLSLVILLMLLCQQPTRRIVLAQAAIVLALFMLPLIAAKPLPRLNALAWYPYPGLDTGALPHPFGFRASQRFPQASAARSRDAAALSNGNGRRGDLVEWSLAASGSHARLYYWRVGCNVLDLPRVLGDSTSGWRSRRAFARGACDL